MSDENNKVSLKEHIIVLLREHDKQHALLKEAIDKAESELRNKQKDANEWRDTVGDFRDKTVSRRDYEDFKTILNTRFQVLENSKANLEGKASQISVIWSYVIAMTAILVSLVNIFI